MKPQNTERAKIGPFHHIQVQHLKTTPEGGMNGRWEGEGGWRSALVWQQQFHLNVGSKAVKLIM